ncbi:MAG: hypothetical protein SNG38_04765 [Rikenellaceae bacterium]
MKYYLLLTLFIMCTSTIKSDQSNSPYTLGEEIAAIKNSKLEEISGIAPSTLYEDCLWVHNDSADEPNVYLINLSGELIATLSFPVKNRDWEAITISDGYLYIGEIGDNRAIYPDKIIYRVAEPTTIDISKRDQKIFTDEYESMKFNFSNGQRDCESMMFDPISSELVLISKREANVMVYTTPFQPTHGDEVILIDSCAELNFTLATAGDISPAGDKILIKNYTNIYFWERIGSQSIVEALSVEPTTLAYDPEPQGEAIAWSTHEDLFYTISEKVGSSSPIIYKYKRITIE